MGHKKWLIPITFAAVSVLLIGGALTWSIVTGVCVPDQDPTPEMQARFNYHNRIVDWALALGLLSFVGASVWSVVLLVRGVMARRRAA
jgi:O-antigen ligase